MNRFMWNALLIVAIGTGFYFYVQLIFSKVTDPLYGSLALLLGCLFAAGISRELMQTTQTEQENSQI
ncbi:hypothetical protein V7654_18445 [Bacillus sp. JJ1609]|uniref:hypothetical protein n=1 Tax=Bacillus sp. JJ1609 TaxID=3122977 RepID=UPI00300032C4